MKLVINKCYGGFGLSAKGCEVVGVEVDDWVRKWGTGGREIERDNPLLIKAMEELGGEVMSGRYAKLEVVEIPDGVEWEIEEYDGMEWVAEKHRSWG